MSKTPKDEDELNRLADQLRRRVDAMYWQYWRDRYGDRAEEVERQTDNLSRSDPFGLQAQAADALRRRGAGT